jgi:hypothetical protein
MRLRTIADLAHHVADRECPFCYGEYPEPCACGGLIHATMTQDQHEDGEPVLMTECDRCGRSEAELGDED